MLTGRMAITVAAVKAAAFAHLDVAIWTTRIHTMAMGQNTRMFARASADNPSRNPGARYENGRDWGLILRRSNSIAVLSNVPIHIMSIWVS